MVGKPTQLSLLFPAANFQSFLVGKVGAGAGALIGGLAKGGKGAAIGALAGGLGGLAYDLATRNKD